MALMTAAIALIAVCFNTILISKLPTFEFIVLVARKAQLPNVDSIYVEADEHRCCGLLGFRCCTALHGTSVFKRGSIRQLAKRE